MTNLSEEAHQLVCSEIAHNCIVHIKHPELDFPWEIKMADLLVSECAYIEVSSESVF
jgi:hypothetical protein